MNKPKDNAKYDTSQLPAAYRESVLEMRLFEAQIKIESALILESDEVNYINDMERESKP